MGRKILAIFILMVMLSGCNKNTNISINNKEDIKEETKEKIDYPKICRDYLEEKHTREEALEYFSDYDKPDVGIYNYVPEWAKKQFGEIDSKGFVMVVFHAKDPVTDSLAFYLKDDGTIIGTFMEG